MLISLNELEDMWLACIVSLIGFVLPNYAEEGWSYHACSHMKMRITHSEESEETSSACLRSPTIPDWNV
jgi:hypothetical protein